MFSDTTETDLFSQNTNKLSLLTKTSTATEATAIAIILMNDTTLTQATFYFMYYLHQALINNGFVNDYLNWLGLWQENIKQGMTTWAEISNINATRSDCHAWGAHPNIELFRTVLGVDANSPGFRQIKIEPHLCNIKKINGAIPHPNGKIVVAYENDTKWKINIELPSKTNGIFIWKGKKYSLKEGANKFQL